MNPRTRVLVIDDEPASCHELAEYLTARSYEVATCAGVTHAQDVLTVWRPHVLVLAPTGCAERHHELEELRRLCPSLPVVILTTEGAGPDFLLDVEAFAPALPAKPERGLGHIASTVAAAAVL